MRACADPQLFKNILQFALDRRLAHVELASNFGIARSGGQQAQNPLRTDFQRHYDEIVAAYNSEKDRVTIEQTFADLLKFVEELGEEESRAMREGLDEESLAIFDLLKKSDLTAANIKRIKEVAAGLLKTLKTEKLRVDHWREKEFTRDAVLMTIHNFLFDENTGLPFPVYTETEVSDKTTAVFQHVFRVYPIVPSPYYSPGVTTS